VEQAPAVPTLDALSLAIASLPPTMALRQSFGLGGRTAMLDVGAEQGGRPYFEDRFACELSTLDDGLDTVVLGVFDGHGGDAVATRLSASLPRLLLTALATAVGEAAEERAVVDTCLAFDALLVADDLSSSRRTARAPGPGSTAALAIVLPRSRSILLANVGDTRVAVVDNATGTVLCVSVDQTPLLPAERARIHALGGSVIVRDGLARVGGVLAISRAFGNAGLQCVTAEPAVLRVAMPAAAFHILLASDGLFDVMTTEQCAAHACSDDKLTASEIATRAANDPHSTLDNITVCILSVSRDEAQLSEAPFAQAEPCAAMAGSPQRSKRKSIDAAFFTPVDESPPLAVAAA